MAAVAGITAADLNSPVVALDWEGKQVEAEAGEWIVGLRPKSSLVKGHSAEQQVNVLERLLGLRGADAHVEEYLGRPGQFVLQTPGATPDARLLRTVRRLPGFEYVQPNTTLHLDATHATDWGYTDGYLWGLNNTGQDAGLADADIDAPEAWDVTRGSGDVVVAVVDSGVDYTHPDLVCNMWVNPGEVAGDGRDNDGNGYVDDVHGINAALNNGNPMDDHGHGTHVAGTIGATGSDGGFVGVNWDVQIMALKFLTADGGGSTADAIEALNYAAAMRQRGVNVKLTSNSWGGGGYEQALRDAIAHQANLGILFVAAAGNDGLNNDAYGSFPANVDLPNVISVAAADRNDALASFSNYGATSVNLSAPGVDIASTAPGGSYVYMSGTSMATPHVSGVAALAWAVKPDATYQEVATPSSAAWTSCRRWPAGRPRGAGSTH